MDKKVLIFGSHGMLGRYVTLYLKKYYTIFEINRKNIDINKTKYESLYNHIHSYELNENDIIINCIGVIKPRVDELGDLNAIIVNSVFPRWLANIANESGIKMIHPTTDCVFSGLRGNYNEDDSHDVTDVYGRTKSLGEPYNCNVIRTSIIGEEVEQGRSLVEWVKKNKGKTVNGYTNHIWNGVTCYQFAKICHELIDKNLLWDGTRHLFSNSVTKYELIQLINNIYDLNLTIMPTEAPVKCDRTLTTNYAPIIEIPPLSIQINEMKEINYELYHT